MIQINEEELNGAINETFAKLNEYKFEEASKILEKYIPMEPTSPYFWNALGHVYRSQVRLNDAYDCFMKATKINPSVAESYYNLGRLEGECHTFYRHEDIRASHGMNIKYDKSKLLYSCYNEQYIIQTILNEIENHGYNINKYVLDIGAGDGMTFSNSYKLFSESKWNGLCIEPGKKAFTELSDAHKSIDSVLIKCFATPDNILSILKAHEVPKIPGLLTLDIDSYDYFVLEKILSEYKPSIICTEITEYVPPPICFALKYVKDNTINSNCFGQSIQMLYKLLKEHEYSIIWLEYNNVFAIHNSLFYTMTTYTTLTPDEAFKRGLLDRIDWQLKMPWFTHSRKEIYLQKDPYMLMDILKKVFPYHENEYICYIDKDE